MLPFAALLAFQLSVSAAEAPARALPDFLLTSVTSESARAVRREDLMGRVWVANFIFTRCTGPCPFNSARMARLQRRLPDDVGLMSFTVDPVHDQARTLRLYARRFGARPGRWMFVTAPNEAVLIPLYKDAFRTAYRAAPVPCGYETFHSAKFFLIDKQGRIRGEYASNVPDELRRLERDALELRREENKEEKA